MPFARSQRPLLLLVVGSTLAVVGCEVLLGIEDRQVGEGTSLPGELADATPAETSTGAISDARADVAAAASVDAPDGAPLDMSCFDVPTRVSEFSTPTSYEWSVRFTSNGLGVYLTRGALAPNDLRGATISYAERAAFGAPFGPFSPVAFDRSDVPTLNAFETSDGRSVFFDTYDKVDPCPNCRHVWVAQRPFAGGAWGAATKIIDSIGHEDLEPFVVGNAAYFVSTRGTDAFKIWRASFDGASVVPSEYLNLAGVEQRAPVATADDQAIFFARSPVDQGVGPYSIWVTTRPRPGTQFGAAQRVAFREPSAVPNPAWSGFPTWISPDGCVLYFRADRETFGDMDIYRSVRCSCLASAAAKSW